MQQKDNDKRTDRRNDAEEMLLQALCDRGGDDGSDWLSYSQSDPVMMLVVLLRNQAAALRDDRPSASDRERISQPKPCCGRDPLLFIQLILVALACRRVLPVALRSGFLLFLIQRLGVD